MSETLTNGRISLVELVRSWGSKPEVAAARTPAPPRRIESYNLRCRLEQESTFDVAMTVMPDGRTAHLKKTTVPKIESDVSLEELKGNVANGQTDWVMLKLGEREISIKRRSLKNALRALLAP